MPAPDALAGTSPRSPRSSPACKATGSMTGSRRRRPMTARLHSFHRGSARLRRGAQHGLTLPWSSGIVEGTVNRIKDDRQRQMYNVQTTAGGFPAAAKRVLLGHLRGLVTITKYGSDPNQIDTTIPRVIHRQHPCPSSLRNTCSETLGHWMVARTRHINPSVRCSRSWPHERRAAR